ncbi:hypothetical protein Avbf_03810 [Armadillidium vulgare]|nr:hypothetical protein Avbf_03810 [Armadillidium vulgare]
MWLRGQRRVIVRSFNIKRR